MLVFGDQLYTLMDRGFLTSNDPRTGKEIYARHLFIRMPRSITKR
jgi:hypothetical protein